MLVKGDTQGVERVVWMDKKDSRSQQRRLCMSRRNPTSRTWVEAGSRQIGSLLLLSQDESPHLHMYTESAYIAYETSTCRYSISVMEVFTSKLTPLDD
jgi:hypothetical protein